MKTKKELQELHDRTYKPRPQWWIDKVTKAYEERLKKKLNK